MNLLASGVCAILGVAQLWGTYRRWSWLVNPPAKLWPFDSQAFFKKVLGQKAAIYMSYLVGVSMLGVAVTLLKSR